MHTSTKWVLSEIVVIGIATTLLSVTGYPLLMPYEWHLFLHILGAILFMGNIVVTALWMFMAEQSRADVALRYAVRMVNWADVVFTAPGIFLLLTNGYIMAYAAWGGLTTSWIATALGLLILSGIVWVAFLIPLQNRLLRYANTSGDALPEQFTHTLRQWYIWGSVVTILPLLSLVLMAVKPQLW